MPPKNQTLVPGHKKGRSGSSKYDEVKTEKEKQHSSKHEEKEKPQTRKDVDVKTMDLFDEEFDIFIRSIEDGITELEEKYKKFYFFLMI